MQSLVCKHRVTLSPSTPCPRNLIIAVVGAGTAALLGLLAALCVVAAAVPPTTVPSAVQQVLVGPQLLFAHRHWPLAQADTYDTLEGVLQQVCLAFCSLATRWTLSRLLYKV